MLGQGPVDRQLIRQLATKKAVIVGRQLDLQVYQAAELGLLADVERQIAITVLGLVDHERQVLSKAFIEEVGESRRKISIVQQDALSLAEVIEALLVEDGFENVSFKA